MRGPRGLDRASSLFPSLLTHTNVELTLLNLKVQQIGTPFCLQRMSFNEGFSNSQNMECTTMFSLQVSRVLNTMAIHQQQQQQHPPQRSNSTASSNGSGHQEIKEEPQQQEQLDLFLESVTELNSLQQDLRHQQQRRQQQQQHAVGSPSSTTSSSSSSYNHNQQQHLHVSPPPPHWGFNSEHFPCYF